MKYFMKIFLKEPGLVFCLYIRANLASERHISAAIGLVHPLDLLVSRQLIVAFSYCLKRW